MYLGRLDRVELVNTGIKAVDITTLGSSAPHLKHPLPATCCINNKNQPWSPQYLYCIDMPNNQLTSVVLLEEHAIKLHKSGLLQLSIGGSTHCLLAGPAPRPLTLISQKNYEMRLLDFAVVLIRCKNLKYLKVNLKSFQFEIEFDN